MVGRKTRKKQYLCRWRALRWSWHEGNQSSCRVRSMICGSNVADRLVCPRWSAVRVGARRQIQHLSSVLEGTTVRQMSQGGDGQTKESRKIGRNSHHQHELHDSSTSLFPTTVLPNPLGKFHLWVAVAQSDRSIPEPEVFLLSTSTPSGILSVRFVVLDRVNARGFVCFTRRNLEKMEGRQWEFLGKRYFHSRVTS